MPPQGPRKACRPLVLTLLGETIENPGNEQAMRDAAQMFGADYQPLAGQLAGFPCALGLENLASAQDVYSLQLPEGAALVAGNERRGLSASTRKALGGFVQIPMLSRTVNCLNVAAASAVMLYYGHRRQPRKCIHHNHPEKRRPELLLMGGSDEVELGSSIRSAAAFGWNRLLVADRGGIWFGCDRVVRSQGRAAARRGKNPIRLLPVSARQTFHFERVSVVSLHNPGLPLARADLARGSSQLVVLADESLPWDDLEQLGRRLEWIQPEVPDLGAPYHLRLISAIVLAEMARQIGRAAPAARPPRWRGEYDTRLGLDGSTEGEWVDLEDLLEY